MAQPATNPKIEELRFRLKTDPKSRLFYQLAEELRRASQFTEAEHVLRTGLTVYPAYLAAWVSLGRCLREQKNDAGAVEALTTALQLDPGNVVAARILADAYLALGEKLEALKKYKLVHALIPADEELRTVIDQLDRDLRPPEPLAVPEPEAEPVAADVPEPVAETASDVFDAPAAETADIADDVAPLPALATVETDVLADAAAAENPAAEEESPFDRTTPPFAEAAQSLSDDIRLETATADVEPMSRAHEDSPFEDPVAGFTADSVEIEAPLGMQIVSAPLSADVPSYVTDDLPTADSTPVFDTPQSAFVGESDDAANTLTMADLYARQGLVEEARHIYESILARDPHNAAVRAQLNAITPRVNPKVVVLERWLSKVSKREVGRV
ncbi:MAG TPA: tetratricopeptide repeat protein [Thermoanaerobaculia bacterium]|nr:tetratricopeptide repeat protein [Thermoanaerobaculia bacterium]